jgi:hypothetical protein
MVSLQGLLTIVFVGKIPSYQTYSSHGFYWVDIAGENNTTSPLLVTQFEPAWARFVFA